MINQKLFPYRKILKSEMLDDFPSFRRAFNRIKRRRISLNTIEQKSFSLLKIMIFLIGISFTIIIIIWVFEEEGINVRPFEVIGIGENSDGKAFALLLSFDLERIKNIYSESDTPGISESKDENKTIPRPLGELSLLSSCKLETVPLEYSISQIGTLSIGGASLSIGNIALCIKEFIGNKANSLTCSLQKYNSTVTTVAILNYRTNDNKEEDFEKPN